MRWRALPVLLLAAGAFGAPLAASLAPRVEPARAGTQCVRDPAWMRRHHMQLLVHGREVTVHEGVRGEPASLRGCIDCHAGATTRSVAAAPTDFCVGCHAYAAVRIDCFECHNPKAAGAATAALRARQP